MVMGILVAPNGTQAMFKVQPMANGVSFAFTPMGGDKNASLENAQVFPFTRAGGRNASLRRGRQSSGRRHGERGR